MLVSAAGLLAAGLISACGTLTTDFVFVTSAKAAGSYSYGEIDIYEVNSESGHMRQIPDSPVPSGGRTPMAEAVTTDNTTLIVANRDDNTLVSFIIGSDGKLYPYDTMNSPGVAPISLATTSSYLFVLNTYQPLATCTSAAPCSGSVSVLPLTAPTASASTAIGSPVTNTATGTSYWPLSVASASGDVITPTALTVSGSTLYITAYDASTATSVGYLFAYTIGSGGTLTPVSGSPFSAGVKPDALTVDSTGKYLYSADYTSGTVWGYSIGSTGALTTLSGSPWAVGNGPAAIVANPAYGYLYVANSTDSNVASFSIGSTGALTAVATYAAGLNPVAIGVDPSTHAFVYTANFLGSTVSDWQVSLTDGTFLVAQGSPVASNTNPTAVAAVPHR